MIARLALAMVAGAGLALAAAPATAHPHIFIEATLRIVFAPDGAVAALEQTWTFDAYHSAWAVQGLDADGDKMFSQQELQTLADGYAEGLDEVHFYTEVDAGGTPVELVRPDPVGMSYEGEQIRMSFVLNPARPAAVGTGWRIQIADPEYYSDITVLDGPGMSLVAAPAGCGLEPVAAKEMDSQTLTELYALPPEVTELPPQLAAALRDASASIHLSCP